MDEQLKGNLKERNWSPKLRKHKPEMLKTGDIKELKHQNFLSENKYQQLMELKKRESQKETLAGFKWKKE